MNTTTPRRALILAPHVDDAEFGLGATIQKRLAFRDGIRVVVASGGDYTRSDGQRVYSADRQQECEEALEYLGVRSIRLAGWFEENQGLFCDYGAMVAGIEREIRDWAPDDVFVCLPSFNQDHRSLFEATVTAFRPGNQTANLYAYEYPGVVWGPAPPQFGKRYYEVNEHHVKRKIEALRMHKSQFEGRQVAVGPDAALTLARQRGAEIGRPFAELVYVLKELC